MRDDQQLAVSCVLPGHEEGHTHRRHCDHRHRTPRLCGLHLILVGVDGAKCCLEVVVVVVVAIVVGVHWSGGVFLHTKHFISIN